MARQGLQWPEPGFTDITNSQSGMADGMALPSSFVMDDGTDWDSHIGSIFGSQLPRKSSSIDFGISDYGSAARNMDDGFTNQLDTTLMCSDQTYPAMSDHITLQDVMDEPELLPSHQHGSWHGMQDPLVDSLTYSSQQLYEQPPLYTQSYNICSSDNDHGYDQEPSSDMMQRDPSESFDTAETTDPCYARLLWKCLHEAPNYTLSLKDIYVWIKQHTQKARDPKNKGWQNSVRHNLSMNAAFQRVTSSSVGGESKKGSLWRLTENAVEVGVISTTRYRRDPKRKPERRGQPALKRQISGAKGGAATRVASHMKRLREARERSARYTPTSMHRHYTTTPDSRLATPVPAHAITYGHNHFYPSSPYYANMASPAIMHDSTFGSPYSSPALPYTHEVPDKGFLREFELSHIEPNTGIFGNVDSNRPYTPSLVADSSYNSSDAAYGSSSAMMASI